MKICLVNLYTKHLRKDPPLGLGYLASSLIKKGFKNVSILDSNYKAQEFIDVKDEIISEQYDTIGFSINRVNLSQSIKLALEVKKKLKNTKIIFGGHIATFLSKKLIKKFSVIDFILKGEAELSLPKLLKNFNKPKNFKKIEGLTYREGKEIKQNPQKIIKDIDKLPFPARNLLPSPQKYHKKQAYATILASRGCPYNCTYCSIQNFYKEKKYRPRDPKKIMQEIEEIVESYEVDKIVFFDDNFLVNKNNLLYIAKEIKKKKLNLSIGFDTRADQIIKNKEIIKKLIKEKIKFLRISVGIESGSQSQLDRYKKGTSVKINEKAIKFLKANNIPFSLFFIFFDPDLNMREVRENTNFLKKMGYFEFNHVSHNLTVNYGTEVFKKLSKEHRINNFLQPIYKLADEKVEKIFAAIQEFEKLNRKIERLKKFIKNKKYQKKKTEIKAQLFLNILNRIFQQFFEELIKNENLNNLKLSKSYSFFPSKGIAFRKLIDLNLEKFEKAVEKVNKNIKIDLNTK